MQTTREPPDRPAETPRLSGHRIGSIAGIKIHADVSLLVVVGLITWSFWDRFVNEYQLASATALVMALVAALLFFGSVLAHELGHALEASHRGIPVEGITLWLFGGATHMREEAHRPGDAFAFTAIGPFTSLAAGAVLGLLATIADAAGLVEVAAVFGVVGWLNVALAVFNMLPGSPLDGGRVVQAIAWRVTRDRNKATRIAAHAGRILGALLIGLGLLASLAVDGGYVDGLWFGFTGWFLLAGAQAELDDARKHREQFTDIAARWAPTSGAAVVRPNPGLRRAVLLGATAAIVAAAVAVPMPFLAVAPGDALPVPPRVSLGVPADPVDGNLLLVAVRVYDVSAVGFVAAWLDDDVDLTARVAVIPTGVDEQEYTQAQRNLFEESVQIAAAVGLRRAGFPVEVSGGGAQVAAVVPGSPADGKLGTGDVIVAIDGQPVRLASDLSRATARASAGDEVTLDVVRDGERREVRVELAKISERDRPAIGVALRSLQLDVRLPFTVEVDQGDVGGPSGGLMLALSIYDLTDPTDLAKGRTIAGTGTIDLEGRIGPVGGVPQKVETARRAGATLFLVPAAEADEARAAADGALEIAPVETFDDALAVLQGG